jgi:hypothetical protein
MVPKHAVLDRAPARTGDLIPPLGKRPSRLPGARIDIDDNEAGSGRGKVYVGTGGSAKRGGRNDSTTKMVGGTMVLRPRKVGWE